MRLCTFRLFEREKNLSHREQLNDFFLVWVRWCLSILLFEGKDLLQVLHVCSMLVCGQMVTGESGDPFSN